MRHPGPLRGAVTPLPRPLQSFVFGAPKELSGEAKPSSKDSRKQAKAATTVVAGCPVDTMEVASRQAPRVSEVSLEMQVRDSAWNGIFRYSRTPRDRTAKSER